MTQREEIEFVVKLMQRAMTDHRERRAVIYRTMVQVWRRRLRRARDPWWRRLFGKGMARGQRDHLEFVLRLMERAERGQTVEYVAVDEWAVGLKRILASGQ